MNLRHIDPRSTDWMDAMLEGELEGGRQKHAKREVDQKAEGEPKTQMLASPNSTDPSPPPGR